MTEAIDNATWLPKALEDSAVYAQTRFSEKPEGRKFSIPEGANLRGADLHGANLYGANLYGANLYGANLRGANLHGADLRDADLADANLRDADLRDADLRGANLRGANLAGANLRGANLTGANLRGADLHGARLDGSIRNRREIISIQTRKYATIYTDEILQIGCKQYPIDEWWGFDDATIAAMDSGALEWWKTHKPLLQALIAANPATPTGRKSKPDSSESLRKQ